MAPETRYIREAVVTAMHTVDSLRRVADETPDRVPAWQGIALEALDGWEGCVALLRALDERYGDAWGESVRKLVRVAYGRENP